MDIKVDARGELCPKPVIMTKKELDKLEEGTITTIVDNQVAKDNVSKLAKSNNCNFEVSQLGEDYYIKISRGEIEASNTCIPDEFKDMTIAFSSNLMGSGEAELGHILMKSFLYTVRETAPYPKSMVFFNSGVKLTTEEGQILDDLRHLESMGVEILVCGTCLDFYKIKEDIKVGEIANMYSIYEAMKNSISTINIG